MSLRRILRATAMAAAVLATLSASALAGGFGGATTLRTAPPGTEIRLGDIAARGTGVVVGWQENAPGGGKAVYVRRSSTGGASFRSRVRLDDRAQRAVQVDTCDGWAWAATELRVSGSWLIALDKLALVGSEVESSVLTLGGLSRKPDVACAGERLVVVWFQRIAGVWRVKLHARGVNDEAKGDSLPAIDRDLGPGDLSKGLAVGGTGDHVFVTWFDGDNHRFRRFDVGPAPDRDLLGAPTAILPDLPDGFAPKIGVSGERLVLAYTNEADLRARVSTNASASWGPERTLEDVPFPSEVAATASSADVIGTRVIVAGSWVGGIEELNGEGFVDRTTNDGTTWARVPGTTKTGGTAGAAYRGTAGAPLIVEAWDRWIVDPAQHRLRFQRQS